MEIDAYSAQNELSFSLGRSLVEPQLNLISRNDHQMQVERRVMEVLLYFVERPGRVVTRDELLSTFWSESLSNDEALTQAISKLRKALGDSAGESRSIQTIRKVGYRLVAPVAYHEPIRLSPHRVERSTTGRVHALKRRDRSWIAISGLAVVTCFNALAISGLFTPGPEPQQPRMVRMRAIQPGVDTTNVELGSSKAVNAFVNSGDLDSESDWMIEAGTSGLNAEDFVKLVEFIQEQK